MEEEEQIKSNTLSAVTFFIFCQNLTYDSSKFLSLGAEKDYCIKFDFWGQPACMHTNVPKEQTRLNEFLAVTFLFF